MLLAVVEADRVVEAERQAVPEPPVERQLQRVIRAPAASRRLRDRAVARNARIRSVDDGRSRPAWRWRPASDPGSAAGTPRRSRRALMSMFCRMVVAGAGRRTTRRAPSPTAAPSATPAFHCDRRRQRRCRTRTRSAPAAPASSGRRCRASAAVRTGRVTFCEVGGFRTCANTELPLGRSKNRPAPPRRTILCWPVRS